MLNGIGLTVKNALAALSPSLPQFLRLDMALIRLKRGSKLSMATYGLNSPRWLRRRLEGLTLAQLQYRDGLMVLTTDLYKVPDAVSYYNEISGSHMVVAVVRRRGSAGLVLPLWC